MFCGFRYRSCGLEWIMFLSYRLRTLMMVLRRARLILLMMMLFGLRLIRRRLMLMRLSILRWLRLADWFLLFFGLVSVLFVFRRRCGVRLDVVFCRGSSGSVWFIRLGRLCIILSL